MLRADAGFAREPLTAWRKANGVEYLFGLARNARPAGAVEAEMAQARAHSEGGGKPHRRFQDFLWRTRNSWSRPRRVVAKAEWTRGKANPRFVVTSLTPDRIRARPLYEKLYRHRGEMENRIKECQLDLFADRTSSQTLRANQLHLWSASMAYVPPCVLRRIGLARTRLAAASCSRSAPGSGSARVGSRSPWPPPIPGRTSSPSPAADYPPPQRNGPPLRPSLQQHRNSARTTQPPTGGRRRAPRKRHAPTTRAQPPPLTRARTSDPQPLTGMRNAG